jgi:hypothetical protein
MSPALALVQGSRNISTLRSNYFQKKQLLPEEIITSRRNNYFQKKQLLPAARRTT